ncbi:MAG: hypothetical protein ACM3O6_08580, partial [Acidobacteriota bacterium]
MLRFDTVIGDIPLLLLGIPLTLGITAAAFLVGTLAGLPIAVLRIVSPGFLGPVARGWVEFFR